MKKFVKSSVLFLLPVFVLLVLLEVMTGKIPNSYSYKQNYILNHGSELKALAMGHSQFYDGFKAESFYLPAFNFCNSGQRYVDNYYLLREYLDDMPNLKMVVMPICYFNVITKTMANDSALTDRSCYYHKYMNIDYDGRLPLKYRFESLNPKRAGHKVFSYYIQRADIIGCDSMGRRSTHYLKDRKHELGYDKIIESETLKEHDSSNFCISEEYYLIQIISLLEKKDIMLVLVTPPYYWNCGFTGVNKEQKKYLSDYMCKLTNNYPVYYIDLGDCSDFLYDDFYNETHLSELGAEKFTQMLNSKIDSIIHSERDLPQIRSQVHRSAFP